jgi:hypothetical protein
MTCKLTVGKHFASRLKAFIMLCSLTFAVGHNTASRPQEEATMSPKSSQPVPNPSAKQTDQKTYTLNFPSSITLPKGLSPAASSKSGEKKRPSGTATTPPTKGSSRGASTTGKGPSTQPTGRKQSKHGASSRTRGSAETCVGGINGENYICESVAEVPKVTLHFPLFLTTEFCTLIIFSCPQCVIYKLWDCHIYY